MHYDRFYECLADQRPAPRVEVMHLAKIVDDRHHGVGKVSFRYFTDFPGAQLGTFVWLEEDRTSPHEDPFRDAIVFINSGLHDKRAERRIVAAKELMHVFDTEDQRTSDAASFRKLLDDMENQPLPEDGSPQYHADRSALWKAILAVIPPWLRSEYLGEWQAGRIKPAELATRWLVPETIAVSAMGAYYEVMAHRFGIDRFL